MNLGAYRNSFIRELSTGTRRIVVRDSRGRAGLRSVEVAVHHLAVMDARFAITDLYSTCGERVTRGMLRANVYHRRTTHLAAVVRTIIGKARQHVPF
jgi:hypothetical protein